MMGMMIAGTLILVAGVEVYTYRKEKGKNKTLSDKALSVLILIAAIVVSACLIIFGAFNDGSNSSKSKSSWDSLSDEKKQWYEENFGNGKMEAYNKAIDDYKSSH